MVDLEVRAVSWSTLVRATGSGLVAGPSQSSAGQGGGHRDGFHLSQAPAAWPSERSAGWPFSDAFGVTLQRTDAALPKARLPLGETAK